MGWFLSALWDGFVVCLFGSALFMATILIPIGFDRLRDYRRQLKADKCWAQIVQARRELVIDELAQAERVEALRIFMSAPEAVARGGR